VVEEICWSLQVAKAATSTAKNPTLVIFFMPRQFNANLKVKRKYERLLYVQV